MSYIGVSLPNNNDLTQVLIQNKFVKDILENQAKVMEVMKVYEQPCNASVEPKLIPNKSDPEKFTIPCSLGNLN